MSIKHTAIHEAGHGVAHFRLNIEQESLSIIPNESAGTLGGCSADDSVHSIADAMNQVVACCSGYAAMIALGYSESEANEGCEDDFEKAEKIITAMRLDDLSGWKEKARGLMSSKSNIMAIKLIADELLEHKRISSGYAEVLISIADGETSEFDFERYKTYPEKYWLE